jgi:hypothetical protein
LVEQDAKGQVHAVGVVIWDEGRGVIPLRGRGSDRARALPHSTVMHAIAEKCVEALEVHRAGCGSSGFGGPTLEHRYGACSSIRCRSWRMNRRVLENAFWSEMRRTLTFYLVVHLAGSTILTAHLIPLQ